MHILLAKMFYFNTFFLKTAKKIYLQRKGPISALHGEPLLCPWLKYTCSFLAISLGWVMLPHPQVTSTDHDGPRTSDLSLRG